MVGLCVRSPGLSWSQKFHFPADRADQASVAVVGDESDQTGRRGHQTAERALLALLTPHNILDNIQDTFHPSTVSSQSYLHLNHDTFQDQMNQNEI